MQYYFNIKNNYACVISTLPCNYNVLNLYKIQIIHFRNAFRSFLLYNILKYNLEMSNKVIQKEIIEVQVNCSLPIEFSVS